MPQTKNIDIDVVNWTITIAIKLQTVHTPLRNNVALCDPKKLRQMPSLQYCIIMLSRDAFCT